MEESMKHILTIVILTVMLCAFTALTAQKSISDDNSGKPIISSQSSISTSRSDDSQPVSDKELERAYPGYLCDVNTGLLGKNKKGDNMRKNPGKHTAKFMLQEKGSGFGVYLRLKKGDYKFFKLDTAGSLMAQDILSTTTKKDNIYVLVKGKIGPEGVIATEWIKEVKKGKDKPKDLKANDKSKDKKEKDKPGKGNGKK